MDRNRVIWITDRSKLGRMDQNRVKRVKNGSNSLHMDQKWEISTYYHRQPLHQPYFVNQAGHQFDQFYPMLLLPLLLLLFLLVIWLHTKKGNYFISGPGFFSKVKMVENAFHPSFSARGLFGWSTESYGP